MSSNIFWSCSFPFPISPRILSIFLPTQIHTHFFSFKNLHKILNNLSPPKVKQTHKDRKHSVLTLSHNNYNNNRKRRKPWHLFCVCHPEHEAYSALWLAFSAVHCGLPSSFSHLYTASWLEVNFVPTSSLAGVLPGWCLFTSYVCCHSLSEVGCLSGLFPWPCAPLLALKVFLPSHLHSSFLRKWFWGEEFYMNIPFKANVPRSDCLLSTCVNIYCKKLFLWGVNNALHRMQQSVTRICLTALCIQ